LRSLDGGGASWLPKRNLEGLRVPLWFLKEASVSVIWQKKKKEKKKKKKRKATRKPP
jgi:hypothetical protein